MFSVTMTDSQQIRVTVSGATDKKGNPAKIDGSPTFESADPAVCTFETDPDDASGMTGIIKATGPLASAAAVSIKADAKLGAEVGEIVENGLVEITAGEATSLGTSVGTAEEQPDAPTSSRKHKK